MICRWQVDTHQMTAFLLLLATVNLATIWHTLTGVKLKNNQTQYPSPEIFWQCTKALIWNYTKRKVFRLCLFCEKSQFIHFAQHTSVKSNKS